MTSNSSPVTIQSLPQISRIPPAFKVPRSLYRRPRPSCPWRNPASIVCTNSLRISGPRIVSTGVPHPTAQPYDGCSTGGNVYVPPPPLAITLATSMVHHIRNSKTLPYARPPSSISEYALELGLPQHRKN
ncbi:hypothetical protein R3P38DRAFT_3282395, partial [Favolaschia claudopus]